MVGPVEPDARFPREFRVQFLGVQHYGTLAFADPSSKEADPLVSGIYIVEQVVPNEWVSERRVQKAFRWESFRPSVRIDGVVGLNQKWSLPLTKEQYRSELAASLSFVNQFIQNHGSVGWTISSLRVSPSGPKLPDDVTVDVLDERDLEEMIRQWGLQAKKGHGRTGNGMVVWLNVDGIECSIFDQHDLTLGEAAQAFRMTADVPQQSLSDALVLPGFDQVSIDKIAGQYRLIASWNVKGGRALRDIRESWKRFAQLAKKLGGG